VGVCAFSVREQHKCSILAIVNESNSMQRNLYVKAAADMYFLKRDYIIQIANVDPDGHRNRPLSPPSGSI